MRLCLLWAILAISACVRSQRESTLTKAERERIGTEVLAVLDSSQNAENAHDANAVMAHWLPTEDFASAGGGEMSTSFAAMDSLVRRNIQHFTHTHFEWTDRRVAVLGRDAAHMLATFRMSVRDSSGDERFVRADWGVLFIRRDGRWWMIRDQGSEVTDSVRPGR
ncbi:MAG TPA: nuclear transport factor 2 family protein [Chloroflexota bacterium]